MKKLLLVILSVLCIASVAACITGCKRDDPADSVEHIHVFDKSVIKSIYVCSPATCTKRGLYYYSCICGEKGSETFEAQSYGHSFKKYVSDNNATCTRNGSFTAKCDRCDETKTITDEGSKLAHTYENKECVYCGYVEPSEGLHYTLITKRNNSYYEVSGIGSCNETNVSVPETYNNLPVKSIGERSFMNCSELTSMTIPDSVTSIGYSAFEGCDSLTKITLPFVGATKRGPRNMFLGYIFGATAYSDNEKYVPSSLKSIIVTSAFSIGKYAFYNCRELTSVAIWDRVTSIGNFAFEGCLGLTNVTMPNTVTSIGSYAFRMCLGLTDITMPNAVTSIGSYAFEWCFGLTNVTMPNTVISIENGAFNSCRGLTSITIPESVTYIGDSAINSERDFRKTQQKIPNKIENSLQMIA